MFFSPVLSFFSMGKNYIFSLNLCVGGSDDDDEPQQDLVVSIDSGSGVSLDSPFPPLLPIDGKSGGLAPKRRRLATFFPENPLSSDSDDNDDDRGHRPPSFHRRFSTALNRVVFYSDEIADSARTPRILGQLFHDNSLSDDSDDSQRRPRRRTRLAPAVRRPDRTASAAPLLISDLQCLFRAAERHYHVSSAGVELAMPYRPWRQIVGELYAREAARPPPPMARSVPGPRYAPRVYDDESSDDGNAHVNTEMDDYFALAPPAVISVPMALGAHPSPRIRPPSPPPGKLVIISSAADQLLKRHLREALAEYSRKQETPSPPRRPIKTEQAKSSPGKRKPPPPTPSSPKSKKPAMKAKTPVARLLAQNPISIEACLRGGHNYLQILMTWIQRNYGGFPSRLLSVADPDAGGRFAASFHLPASNPPLKIQATVHANSKKSARLQIARQSVLYIQKKKLGTAVRFATRKVDPKTDQMVLATAESDDDSGELQDPVVIKQEPIEAPPAKRPRTLSPPPSPMAPPHDATESEESRVLEMTTDELAIQVEAQAFLDRLSSPTASSSLCVARRPGDPFVVVLDEETTSGSDEDEVKQKLMAIKSEMVLLKERIARAEAHRRLQKR